MAERWDGTPAEGTLGGGGGGEGEPALFCPTLLLVTVGEEKVKEGCVHGSRRVMQFVFLPWRIIGSECAVARVWL